MAIAASRIAQVIPRVSNPGTATLEMNGLMLTQSVKIEAQKVVEAFTSAADVALFFGSDSPEYTAASAYFTGFDGSSLKPTVMFFGRHVATDVDAYTKGAAITVDWPTFLAEGNGSLTLTVDSVEYTVTDLDISGATSFSDMATLVQGAFRSLPDATALEDLVVTFTSAGNAFTFTAPVNTLVVTGGNLEGRMGFLNPAKISDGVKARTITETMNLIAAGTPGWVGFSTVWKASIAEALELAAWSGAQQVTTLYVNWDDDPEMLEVPGTSVIEALENATAEATTSCYASNPQLAAFVLGVIGSINFDGIEGSATLAFRRGPGMVVTVADTESAKILDDKKCNYYGNFATRNTQFKHFYSGRMYGEYGWIDPYVNAIWLNTSFANSIISGFQRNNRVPYNDEGYTIVRGWLMGPVNTALRNGVIDTGITLSEAQRAEIIRDAKQDITGDLETLGYFIQIVDPGAEARGNRQSPIVNFWYTYAGSVHKLSMASIAIL